MQERVYRTESGHTIKLDLHKENIVHQFLGGEMYTTKNHVNYCEGSDQMVHGRSMENTIVFDQLKIKIIQNKIFAKRNKRLISNTDMIFLPTTCSAHHGVCFAETATYIWDVES